MKLPPPIASWYDGGASCVPEDSGKGVGVVGGWDALLAGAERLRLWFPDGRGGAVYQTHQGLEGGCTRFTTHRGSAMARKVCLWRLLLSLRSPRACCELSLQERKGRVEVHPGSHDGLWRRFLLVAPDNAA